MLSQMPKQKDSVLVALLRGINVGGKNKLPMKDLAAIFAKAGCGSVKTYIQSGNVVFTSPAGGCDGLADNLSKMIDKQFGHRPPVVLRSLKEMEEVVRANPFTKDGADEKALHVVFLADKPSTEAVKSLDPNRSPGDAFTVRGQDIYLKLGKGMGNTKLTNAFFDSKLKTISTARNWNTVQTLVEMMKEGL